MLSKCRILKKWRFWRGTTDISWKPRGSPVVSNDLLFPIDLARFGSPTRSLLNIPVTPFFNRRDIRKLIMRATPDMKSNQKMFWYFSMKFEADEEENKKERKKRYKEILKFFQSEHSSLTVEMLHIVENLLTDLFPKKFASYRNSIAHMLNDVYERNDVKWYYAFKIMQLTGLLCMLRHIGIEKEEIDQMFHLNQINEESRIKIIIEKSVGI
jgi:hypothetical protein